LLTLASFSINKRKKRRRRRRRKNDRKFLFFSLDTQIFLPSNIIQKKKKKINFLNASNKETGNQLVKKKEGGGREREKQEIDRNEGMVRSLVTLIEKSLMYPQVTATKWSSVIGNTFHSGRRKKVTK
jgi:hypothetical protein